jgi:hypothetical protein
MAIIYRTAAFLPLSSSGERFDNRVMVAATLVSMCSVGVFIAAGWLTDRLLSAPVDRWARSLVVASQAHPEPAADTEGSSTHPRRRGALLRVRRTGAIEQLWSPHAARAAMDRRN